MKVQLLNANILDPRSKYHNKKRHISLDSGVITDISNQKTDVSSIDLKGKYVLPGLMDMSATVPDPGNEHKEDLLSALNGARSSGFTKVAIHPDSDPFRDSKGGIEYILSKTKGHEVDVLPYGGISENGKGERMAELMDLKLAGAVGFSNGLNPLDNTELLLRVLQYTKSFEGIVINRPLDPYLSKFGQMHEGEVSTGLGLRGIPAIAEALMIQRDIEILKYAGGRLHFSSISSEESVKIIAQARKKLNVTCDVAIHNLLYTDANLEDFNSNYKVMPPLRSERHRKALLKGLDSGVIDAITSDHQPQDVESKNLEFDLAEFGMSSFQTFVPNLLLLSEDVSWDILLEKLVYGPREILGIDEPKLDKGARAEFIILDPTHSWELNHETNPAKSANSPLFGNKLTGMCIGVVNGKKSFLPESEVVNA